MRIISAVLILLFLIGCSKTEPSSPVVVPKDEKSSIKGIDDDSMRNVPPQGRDMARRALGLKGVTTPPSATGP